MIMTVRRALSAREIEKYAVSKFDEVLLLCRRRPGCEYR